jgi:hypothetical protein
MLHLFDDLWLDKTLIFIFLLFLPYEEFEDTKGEIRIHKSKKNRLHNDQKKKYKRTNNDLQNRNPLVLSEINSWPWNVYLNSY